ncbi:MAG TPA: hypothetical protein VHX44_12660, partial [Planctomycetota bacterium]|nr:hypothetical protein [Planctomycetota bacterium]
MIRSLINPLVALGLGLFLAAPAHASQAVADEVARYREAADKAERAYQDGIARERVRTLNTLTVAAKRVVKTEPEAADALYKLALQVDDMNTEAREHFTASGKLNAVLTEVAAKKGPLIGDGQVSVAKKSEPKVDMAGAKAIRVTSSFNAGYTLGSFKTGTVLIFQYVSGTWSGNNEAGDPTKNQSPDDEKSDIGNRMQLFIDSGNEPVELVTIPTGTLAKPFVYTLDRDVVGLSLRIVNRKGLRNLGGNGGGGAAGGMGGRNNYASSYNGDV